MRKRFIEYDLPLAEISEEPAFVTGQNIFVDGGITATQ